MRHISLAWAAQPAGGRFEHHPQNSRSFGPSDPDDWHVILHARLNVLVTGASAELESFLRAARSLLVPPVRSIAAREAVAFERAGTLILRDVDGLTPGAQRTLFAWMSEPEHASTQIVSTASAPLFPTVEAGRFDRDLYYRLNMICLAIGS